MPSRGVCGLTSVRVVRTAMSMVVTTNNDKTGIQYSIVNRPAPFCVINDRRFQLLGPSFYRNVVTFEAVSERDVAATMINRV